MFKDICKRVGFKPEFEEFFLKSFEELEKNEENLRAMTKGIVIPGKEMTQSESDEDENRYKNQETEEI